MKHRSVALLVGMMASVAVCMSLASAASAAEYQSEAEKTYITGVNSGGMQFTLGGLPFTCTSFTSTGEVQGTYSAGTKTYKASSILLSPTISGCKTGGQTVFVESNGCQFELTEPHASGTVFALNPFVISCPAGKDMVFNLKTGGCLWHVGAQSISSASTVKNVGTGKTRSLEVTFGIHTLEYSTESGGVCGKGSLHEGSMGVVENLTGFRDKLHKEQVGLFIG